MDYLGTCARNRGLPPARLDPGLPWLMDEDRQRKLGQPRHSTVLKQTLSELSDLRGKVMHDLHGFPDA